MDPITGGLIIIIGILALLGAGKSASADTSTPKAPKAPEGGEKAPNLPPPTSVFENVFRARVKSLKARAAQGASWRADLFAALEKLSDAALAAAGFAPTARGLIADAAARWVGIESGGNPASSSSMGERGLVQIGEGGRKAEGISDADWAALGNPKTPRAEQARMAIHHVLWQASKAPAAWTQPDDRLFYAKMAHGLPLYLVELKKLPGFVDAGPSTYDKSDSRFYVPWRDLKASARLASFGNLSKVKSTWPRDTGAEAYKGPDGLVLRFVAPAAVVSDLADGG